VETLADEYVTAWVLAKHLPRIAEEAEAPAVRALARKAHAKYQYPVDSQVWTSEGELLDQVAANDLFGLGAARYLELLAAPAPRDEMDER